MTEECFCGGNHPEWDYHHPEGCAGTAQAFAMLGLAAYHAEKEPIVESAGGER